MTAFDFMGAQEARSLASVEQERAETAFVKAAQDYAQAEFRYRMALASEIARQHAAGVAWTVCPDLARGEPDVASKRFERDMARAVREGAYQALRRHEADRRDLGRLMDWSRAIDLRTTGGHADVRAAA